MIANEPGKSLTAIIALGLMLGSVPGSVVERPYISTAPLAIRVTPQVSDVHTIRDARLQFELPQGWKLKTEENGQIVVLFADGAASITFVVEDKSEQVVASLKAGLKEKLTAMKSDGEAKESTHNGMVHISESGTGLMKGMKITWSIDVLKAGKTVTLLTFGSESALQSHIDDYLKFVASLKKI